MEKINNIALLSSMLNTKQSIWPFSSDVADLLYLSITGSTPAEVRATIDLMLKEYDTASKNTGVITGWAVTAERMRALYFVSKNINHIYKYDILSIIFEIKKGAALAGVANKDWVNNSIRFLTLISKEYEDPESEDVADTYNT